MDKPAIKESLDQSYLFVCSANTCRSPLAAVIMRNEVACKLKTDIAGIERQGIIIRSAGPWARSGAGITPESRVVLAEMSRTSYAFFAVLCGKHFGKINKRKTCRKRRAIRIETFESTRQKTLYQCICSRAWEIAIDACGMQHIQVVSVPREIQRNLLRYWVGSNAKKSGES